MRKHETLFKSDVLDPLTLYSTKEAGPLFDEMGLLTHHDIEKMIALVSESI